MSVSALWAKKAKEGAYWLPLDVHLKDTAEVARKLWREWLPESTKRIIADSIGGDMQEAEKLFIFLAAAHDIGKATPVFQATRTYQNVDLDQRVYEELIKNNFKVKNTRKEYASYADTPHGLASQLLLENAKELNLGEANLNTNAAVILGAHHGKPPDRGYRCVLNSYKQNFGRGVVAWADAQHRLIQLALEYSGYVSLDLIPRPTMVGQVLLSGLIVVADWIASNEKIYQLISLEYSKPVDIETRLHDGWGELDFPQKWFPYLTNNYRDLYAKRFPNEIKEPREMQKAALELAISIEKPGIMVIEAPMGSGKTEAALVVAEVFRDKADSGGVFFALPTQATSNGIFPRLKEWMENLDFELDEKHSINLVHGKAQFHKGFLKLFEGQTEISGDDDEESVAIVHQWFNGRKKGLLADFVVGTIDQLLLMALKQKHVMLRHLGLAGKIVVIDECHAYDAYMSQYLLRALEWLGAYKVPVIVLSATLPIDKRREVVCAYLRNKSITGKWAQSLDYPLITYSDEGIVNHYVIEHKEAQRIVNFEQLPFTTVVDKLEELLSDGGYAGVIMNTVHRAQDMARKLREKFDTDTIKLIHSRFIAADRIVKEDYLRSVLGKESPRSGKLIVVGTQVLEQSLDIDFDVLITDIAPMDLLLQRIGRLHRHNHKRPCRLKNPTCFITGMDGEGFDKGIDVVYDKHLLIRTRDLLDRLAKKTISLPKDISRLVNQTYEKITPAPPEQTKWEARIREKEQRAGKFRMDPPLVESNFTIENWLNTYVDDKHGDASVRDSHEVVDVLVIKKTASFFSMINGKELPIAELEDELAKELACQSVSLPRQFSGIDTIKELRDIADTQISIWQASPWITGELFLVFNEKGAANLCGNKVMYSSQDGLYIDSNRKQYDEKEY